MLIAKILLFLLGALIAFYIFMQLIGWITILAYVFGFLFIAALVVYFCFPQLFRGSKKSVAVTHQGSPKLWDMSGSVTAFVDKPSVQQITTGESSKAVTIQLETDTDIKIIEDDGDVVLKIKVLSGKEKGSIAWVERGSVKGYKRP